MRSIRGMFGAAAGAVFVGLAQPAVAGCGFCGVDAKGAEPKGPEAKASAVEGAQATAHNAIEKIKAHISEKSIDTSGSGWKTKLPKFPSVSFTGDHDYYWKIKTNKGDIKIKLLPGDAPNHVANTIYLTELGYYDGLPFHRIITGFMAQGGCPLGTGSGNPGYKFSGEFDSGRKHNKPGLLSMANAGPDTDGAQFFITFVQTPWLDGKHTIYGEVVDGMDTVKALENSGSRSGRPSEKLVMEKATIEVAHSGEDH